MERLLTQKSRDTKKAVYYTSLKFIEKDLASVLETECSPTLFITNRVISDLFFLPAVTISSTLYWSKKREPYGEALIDGNKELQFGAVNGAFTLSLRRSLSRGVLRNATCGSSPMDQLWYFFWVQCKVRVGGFEWEENVVHYGGVFRRALLPKRVRELIGPSKSRRKSIRFLVQQQKATRAGGPNTKLDRNGNQSVRKLNTHSKHWK